MKEVKRPVVSVVVPVYNTELFLGECLYSLEKQTLTDIEIILVNDGSTDNSGELLREYAGKDARCVYVEQANQGLSAARNTGIEYASGHYLAFLDSDDWITPDATESLVRAAVEDDCDLVIADFYRKYIGGTSGWAGAKLGKKEQGVVCGGNRGVWKYVFLKSDGLQMLCPYGVQLFISERFY